MIRVVKINRKKVALGILALLGIACCAAGFGGFAQKLTSKDKIAEPTSVYISKPEAAAPEQTGEVNQEAKNSLNSEPVIEETADDSTNPEAFFVEYRMDRERARGKQVELLREVMASSSIDEDTRKSAHEKFLSISSNISKEMELENLLRARGFQDAAVFLDGDSVTVVVQPGKHEVAASDNSDLAQLVAKSTGVTEDNVIIITKDF